jgi:hypothetical protein
VCAGKDVTIDPVCERVALSARSLQKSSMCASAGRTSLYDEITANIIAEFEADRAPWDRTGAQRQRSASKKTVTHAVFI